METNKTLPQYKFIMTASYMTTPVVSSTRKALLRLSYDGKLELIATVKGSADFEQIFNVPLNSVTKVKNYPTMTYIYIGASKYRLYSGIGATSVAGLADYINDPSLDSLIENTQVDAIITDSKALNKSFKSLGLRSKYIGINFYVVYGTLGILAVAILITMIITKL